MRAMQDSGAGWLGEIPTDWTSERLDFLFENSKKKNKHLGIESYLSLMANRGIIPYAEKGDVGNKAPADFGNSKTVKKGDFVINSMNFGIGSFGVSNYEGIVSTVYFVLRPDVSRADPGYLRYIFLTTSFRDNAQNLGSGILEHRASIPWEKFKIQKLPVPPISEQENIRQYLDRETSQIDHLISKQEQLIEKLLERRQALITQVVTKGLDSKAPMKDSGVEWVGKYPSHWRLVRVASICRIQPGYSFDSKLFELDGEIPVIRMSDLTKEKSPVFVRGLPSSLPSNVWVTPGDLVLGMTGDYKAIVWRKSRSALNQRLASLRFTEPTVAEYALFPLQIALQYANDNSLSTTIKNLSLSELRNIRMPMPPTRELENLLFTITKEVDHLDSLLEKVRLSLQLLSERRQALITQVVTGKIDVRGFAGGNS